MKKQTFIFLFLGFLAKKLVSLFSPIGIFYAVIRISTSKKYTWNDLRQYFENIAVSYDQLGNVEQAFFYNDIMIKKGSSDLFGFPDETLSSVFGKNNETGYLTKFGYFWKVFLNKVDDNHVQKSIESEEGSAIKKK